jgi:L-asparaginase II
MTDAVVEVTRGSVVESRHRVHIAVAHAERGLVASAGNAGLVSFVRSAIKMFQALPLVEGGGVEQFDLTTEELAVCTASHGGEPFHVAAARSILRKADASEDLLACGPHPPMHPSSADALAACHQTPGRIHNNCSGKHAGMLAFATLRGWPHADYHRPYHPVQQRVIDTIAHWMDVPVSAIVIGVDGCGLPTFALPLDRVAHGCARIAAAATDGGSAAARVIDAMLTRPAYVAGTDRLCTDLMVAAGGRLFAKVGAEGYYCVGVPHARLGIALKVEDGAKRAAEPAVLAVLRALNLVNDSELDILARYARPDILNTRGEIVGMLRVSLPALG